MNHLPDIQVKHSFELMRRLRDTCADFSKREARLSREVTNRRALADQKLEEEISQASELESSNIREAESTLEQARAKLHAHSAQRINRIDRAQRNGLANLQKLARRKKEKRKGELQLIHFNAGRQLPLDLEAADQRHQTFSSELEEIHRRLRGVYRASTAAFTGMPGFRKQLETSSLPAVSHSQDRDVMVEELKGCISEAEEKLQSYKKLLLPALFRYLPMEVLIPILLTLGALVGFFVGRSISTAGIGVAGAAAGAALAWALNRAARSQATELAHPLMDTLSKALGLHGHALRLGEEQHATERSRIQTDYDNLWAKVNEEWETVEDIESTEIASRQGKFAEQAPKVRERHTRMSQARLDALQAGHEMMLDKIQHEAMERKTAAATAHQAVLEELSAYEDTRWTQFEEEWQAVIPPLYSEATSLQAELAPANLQWTPELVENWKPFLQFPPGTRFAELAVDLVAEGVPLPQDPRLALPGPPALSFPIALTYPAQGSLLIEAPGSGDPLVVDILNHIILRLLVSTPPGKVTLTILDPVGLGQSFAGLMHLADHEESIINRRIWTQREQIEERLEELNGHIEKVIQMYLRNEYATITEYNQQAGSVAEKYHFLVVADFPEGFGEVAVKRLQSIAMSGPRCGVFILLHQDSRQPHPAGWTPEDLRQSSVWLRRDRTGWTFPLYMKEPEPALHFEKAPEPELALGLVRKIGRASVDSNRVEVPFRQITPVPEALWKSETTHELRVPIGRTGATKFQELAIGKGTRQHALFAGKTGSGKSTLFHVIITNLALHCAPDQVEFYLIDFKKGVEFKCYADKKLPHARVIAIESDREFALSVLQRVDEELKRRGDMFRALGVQDLAGYKRAGGTEVMPRSLLLIDEFQEFFVEDDTIAQTASLLFDRIVRQGRAFGIHVLLGSQTLGGAYTLARATLGQMVIRVALQCNEADAYLIMDDTNPAPRLLSRPGEGIYNDAAGAIEGNSPFQVVWLPDEERDQWLDQIRDLEKQHPHTLPPPVVFEGNTPADVRDNLDFAKALTQQGGLADPVRCWLGAPNSIKGATEATFANQGGNHLLVVGQREEPIMTLIALSTLAIAAQHAEACVWVLSHDNDPTLAIVSSNYSPRVELCTAVKTEAVLETLYEHLQRRLSGEESVESPLFLIIQDLQKFKKLRAEDEFDFGDPDAKPAPSKQLALLIEEGSALGIHLILSVDTYAKLTRFLGRKALSEIEMKVVFQMSPNDSSSLIDTPAAANLGLHRAIFHNEQSGRLETFRPYAPPHHDWLNTVLGKV